MAQALNWVQAVLSTVAILLVFIGPIAAAGRAMTRRLREQRLGIFPPDRAQDRRDIRLVILLPTIGFLLGFVLDVCEVIAGQPYNQGHWIFEGVTAIFGGIGVWGYLRLRRANPA